MSRVAVQRIKDAVSITILVLSCVIIPACGQSDPSKISTEYEGTWVSNCQVNGGTSGQNIMIFQGTFYHLKLSSYTDTTCTTRNTVRDHYKTFSIGDSFPAIAGSIILNLTEGIHLRTPYAAATVTSWNNTAQCGLTNWVSGVGQSDTGTSCSGSPIGTKEYEAFVLSEANTKLQSTGAGAPSVDQVSTTLGTKVYTKQ